MSGREGILDAHAWYRSPGAKDEKWVDTDGAVLLELRSNGRETFVATSVHLNGERNVRDRDGAAEPTEVAAEELKRRCAELATATLVARLPPADVRHRFAMAICARRRIEKLLSCD